MVYGHRRKTESKAKYHRKGYFERDKRACPIFAKHCYGSRATPMEYKSIKGLEHIDKIIEIDQSPIGRTPRSNPATYCGFFTEIRTLFASIPEAKIRGYNAGRFSFNVKSGRCDVCEGGGMRVIEMN